MPNEDAGGEGEGKKRQRNALAVCLSKPLILQKTRITLTITQCGRCRQRKIKCEGDEGEGCQACRSAGQAKCSYLRVEAITSKSRGLYLITGPYRSTRVKSMRSKSFLQHRLEAQTNGIWRRAPTRIDRRACFPCEAIRVNTPSRTLANQHNSHQMPTYTRTTL